MINPWHKRANELIRDPLALLPLISPQPVRQFFKGDAASLFDRLVIVVGAPGSGKTTLARLLEFSTLAAAIDAHDQADLGPLIDALNRAQIVGDLLPRVLGVRIPANAQYRAIWELPYSEEVRHKLLRSLLQARAVLGWLRQLEQEHIDVNTIRIVTSGAGDAQRVSIAADSPREFRQLARDIELQIFKVVSALVPPPQSALGDHISSITYDPLSSVSAITIQGYRDRTELIELRPLLMVDDAHELHQHQFADLDRWLHDREVRVARWVLTRIDSISPSEFRHALVSDAVERPLPGTSPDRDRILRMLQARERKKSAFRKIALDISRRYLAQIGAFALKGINKLDEALLSTQPRLSPSELRRLRDEVAALVKDSALTPAAEKSLAALLPENVPEDLRLAITRIVLHREALRSPQRSLFASPTSEVEDTESSRKMDRAVITGAEIQLMHQFDRPFFYGFDRLTDASNDNIEQFISLASVLVDELDTIIVRGRKAELDAKRQHTLLRSRAQRVMRAWDFPYSPHVRKLVEFISQQCVELTLRANAPLDDGANAFGIPQDDLRLLEEDDILSRVVHYALAYQALVMVEEYNCKGKQWCLFELGGIPSIVAGVTLNRGGFVEGRLTQFQQLLAR